VLFSRPSAAPVSHLLKGEPRKHVAAGRPLSVVVQDGPAVRTLVYLPVPGAGGDLVVRFASTAPDLEEELRERQQVLLGHVASLGALVLAGALVLLPRRSEPSAPPEGALSAYEQAMEKLRDRGEEMSARHEAERRRMEEAIRENEALARAGELTAGIAHEVRNGLGTIVGYARMLERGSLPEEPSAAARAIRGECETLETVVRRFTDFVKLEKLHLVPTDLSRLLARVAAREARAREEVRTRLVGLDAPLVVWADEELLERALENVVRNAVEAAAAGGGHVDVTACGRGDRVEVRIEDDGPGLAPGHTGEIRAFYTTRPGGLGLGLPLARKILLLHGGSLQLANRANGGAEAVLTLAVQGPRP
jgi:signal transduction histidine kinase